MGGRHCIGHRGTAVKVLLDAKAETAMQSKEGSALHLPLPGRSGEGAAGW